MFNMTNQMHTIQSTSWLLVIFDLEKQS
uniref:Uncharacterized protein n=1 Tax=Arundo donax TaxID=35708 RepID=A0A0A8ZV84_ARUDO